MTMERVPQAVELSAPKTLISYINPVAATARRGMRKLHELCDAHDIELIQIETDANGKAGNQARLAGSIADHYDPELPHAVAVASVGGDGTINEVADLITSLDASLGGISYLPIPGGNGNDGARNAHTARGLRQQRGQRTFYRQPTNLLYAEFQTQTGCLSRKALSYMGFNVSAAIAEAVDNDRGCGNRLTQITREKALAYAAIRHANQAPITVKDMDGTQQLLLERTFANGSGMAKHIRWPNNDIGNPWFQQFDLAPMPNTHIAMMAIATRLAFGRLPGNIIRGQSVSFTTSATKVQCDGEVLNLPEATGVRISHYPQPINLLRLALPS